MILRGRLKLVADMVPVCRTVCDVGTDHAYIPIYLIRQGICKTAIATDVNPGPIEKANINIRQYEMTDYIDTRIGDGLQPLKEQETEIIVIAGMGGQLICSILSEGIEKARNAKRLVIQPMGAVEDVRRWLYDNGFEITDEGLVMERNKIYNVISASWTGQQTNYDIIDLYVGRRLIEKNDPLLKTYIKRELNKIDTAINGLRKSRQDNRDALEKNINLRDEFIKLYNGL
ncbi:MAG TPA: SAM-dependent methyltransferase [Clostridiaceae bacterium]|nr:SAM-dependent methyltransferase [Clostridiaceae bacterium]